MISVSDVKVNFADKKTFGSDSKFGGLKPLSTGRSKFGMNAVQLFDEDESQAKEVIVESFSISKTKESCAAKKSD